MAKQLYHFKDLDLITDTIEVHLRMSPTAKRVQKAHNGLQVDISNSMLPFMPKRDGELQEVTRAMNTAMIGSSYVYAAFGVPYGRMQYRGLVMVDEVTGSPWARKGARKVVTDRALKYSQPRAQPEWYEAAKKSDLKKWVDAAQKILDGG